MAAGSVPLDPDAFVYIRAMSVSPGRARRTLINDLVVGLKDDGLWSKIDWLLLLAAHDAQAGLVNLRNPAKVATAVSSPVFTADRGYAGTSPANSTPGGYITLNEAFGAAGNAFTQNSAFIFTYVNGGTRTTPVRDIGPVSDEISPSISMASASSGTDSYRINGPSTDTITSTGKVGSRMASRTSSSTARYFKNGSLKETHGDGSVALDTNPGAVLRGGSYYSDSRIAVAASGSGLDTTEGRAFHDRILTYLTAIGAN